MPQLSSSKTLDVRGYVCPIPVWKAKKAIAEIEVGQVLEILASDPTTKNDIPSWAQREGHNLLNMAEGNGVFRFHVQRGK